MRIGQIEVRKWWSAEGYLVTVVAILALTALAKIVSLAGDAAILDHSDPLFGFLSNRQMLLLAAAMEVGVAVVLVFSEKPSLVKVAGMLCLATGCLSYRSRLWAIQLPARMRVFVRRAEECAERLLEVLGARESQHHEETQL